LGGGERLHHFKGCRHHGGFPGETAQTVHRHQCRVRNHTFGMVQGNQGAAQLLHSTQAGLLHQRKLPARHRKGRTKFFKPLL